MARTSRWCYGRGDHLYRARCPGSHPPGSPRGRRCDRPGGGNRARSGNSPHCHAGRRRIHRCAFVNLEVIRLWRCYDTVVMPGGFTPTEVLTAWEAGADVVKIFPADVGGPAYLRALRGPLPQVRLMPTGVVDLTTAEAFLKAGACCLGVGGALVE